MSNPIIRIHNALTNEIIDREMTDIELAENNAMKENVKKEKTEREANAVSKAALLTRLGITAEEAQLLLGGN